MVYRVFDTVLQRVAALKTLRGELLGQRQQAELVARFLRPMVFRPLGPDARVRIVALHLGRFLDWHSLR